MRDQTPTLISTHFWKIKWREIKLRFALPRVDHMHTYLGCRQECWIELGERQVGLQTASELSAVAYLEPAASPLPEGRRSRLSSTVQDVGCAHTSTALSCSLVWLPGTPTAQNDHLILCLQVSTKQNLNLRSESPCVSVRSFLEEFLALRVTRTGELPWWILLGRHTSGAIWKRAVPTSFKECATHVVVQGKRFYTSSRSLSVISLESSKSIFTHRDNSRQKLWIISQK